MPTKNIVLRATLAKQEATQEDKIRGFRTTNTKEETTQDKKTSELLAHRKQLIEEHPQEEQKADADKDPVHVEESAESLEGLYAALAYQDPAAEFSDRIEFAQLGSDIAGAGAGGGVGAGATGLGTVGPAGAASAGAWVAAGVAAGTAATVTTTGVTAGAVAVTAAVAGVVAAVNNDTGDKTAPTVTALQSFNYPENSNAGATMGTVAATDNIGVTGYRFAVTSTSTSADGLYEISSSGVVTLTAAGAAAASNDFETGANSFTYGIQARDAAGNWSSAVNVSFNVTDSDEIAPVVAASQSLSYSENQAANAVVGMVAASDAVGVTGYRFENSGGVPGATSTDGYFTIAANGEVSITAAGVAAGVAQNDFETGANSFIYGIQARDAAGNWSASTNVAFNLTDLLEFTYTENRPAGSFIGSVDASDYLFWDPVTQTRSGISPDGYFRIDSNGRIFLTAEGAASYVNDAEDTQAGGPLNGHQYFIQAKAAGGTWSTPVSVKLNESDCSCDTPNQQAVYDITRNGTTDIEIKNGAVGRLNLETYQYDAFEQADAGETLIRIVAPDQRDTGIIDPWGDGTSTIIESGKALLYIRSDALGDMLPDVECIRLEAKGEAKAFFSSSSSISNGQLFTPDNFMASLQKVSVAGSQNGGFGLVSWLSYNSGGSDYMSSLKAIDLNAGLGSIMMELRNNIETKNDNGIVYQPGPASGDNFMKSLETIYAASGVNGKVELDLRNSGGADFMQTLTSITALAGSGSAEVEIEAVQQRLVDENYDPLGIAGNNENFMSSLEVIALRSLGSGADLDILNELGDNYMSKLSLIDVDSARSQNLEIVNRGGDNFMSSLESIVLDRGTSVLLDIYNEQFIDVMGVLYSADDFMSALQSLTVDTASATVRLRNGIFYDDDGSQAGFGYLDSLQSIDVRGSAGVTFQLLSGSQDAATLRSLTSVTLTGGTVDARFSAYMENETWFDLKNISGLANGEQDYFYIWDADRLNDVNVFAGFGAGAENDILFLGGLNLTQSDLNVSTADADGNVRITFVESTGYAGSIILTGVGNDFDMNNIGGIVLNV